MNALDTVFECSVEEGHAWQPQSSQEDTFSNSGKHYNSLAIRLRSEAYRIGNSETKGAILIGMDSGKIEGVLGLSRTQVLGLRHDIPE